MEVILFNDSNSKFDSVLESIYLRPLLLFADKVCYLSIISTYMEYYRIRDKWTSKYFMGMYKFLKLEQQTKIPAKDIEDIEKKLKFINRIKHKNKQELYLQHIGNKMLKAIKESVVDCYKNLLSANGILALQPFVDREIFHAYCSFYIAQQEDKEDLYVKGLYDNIIDNYYCHVFGEVIEKLMAYTTLNTLNGSDTDNEAAFIQTPLFDFPSLKDLDYKQMDYTRENLKEKFQTIKQKIKELELFIKPLSFKKENWKQIAKQFNELIHPLLEPIQQDIDAELYLQQAKQKYKETLKMNLCLGITSITGMIDYYEKVGIIQPYVAKTIKRNLARETDTSASCIFIYIRLSSDKEK